MEYRCFGKKLNQLSSVKKNDGKTLNLSSQRTIGRNGAAACMKLSPTELSQLKF